MLLLKNKHAAIKSEHDSKGNLIKVSHLSYLCVTLPSLLAIREYDIQRRCGFAQFEPAVLSWLCSNFSRQKGFCHIKLRLVIHLLHRQ